MAEVAKAVAAGLAALVGSLALVISGNETFADVSTLEWLIVAGHVLGSYGFVWYVPNKPAS